VRGLGASLFRLRGVIGAAAAVAVAALGRPTAGSVLWGLPVILAGLALRFWAMGHIGAAARSSRIGALARVTSGPYRLLRHPLYLGNALIVAGMLVAFWVPPALAATVAVGFVVAYGLMARAEERQLAGLPEERRRFEPGRAAADWWAWLGCAVMLGAALARAAVRAGG
jgi:protein-S-isoprenylcysteine O-methyltransferase Ste14